MLQLGKCCPIGFDNYADGRATLSNVFTKVAGNRERAASIARRRLTR
jgi:hypothetical protein